MDFLFELLFEIIGDCFEALLGWCLNSKRPKVLRYTVAALLMVVILLLTVGLILLGISIIGKNAVGGWIVISIGAFLGIIFLYGIIKKLKKQ